MAGEGLVVIGSKALRPGIGLHHQIKRPGLPPRSGQFWFRQIEGEHHAHGQRRLHLACLAYLAQQGQRLLAVAVADDGNHQHAGALRRFQANVSAWASAGAARSFSDSSGSAMPCAARGQSTPMAGSFQATLRSCSGA